MSSGDSTRTHGGDSNQGEALADLKASATCPQPLRGSECWQGTCHSQHGVEGADGLSTLTFCCDHRVRAGGAKSFRGRASERSIPEGRTRFRKTSRTQKGQNQQTGWTEVISITGGFSMPDGECRRQPSPKQQTLRISRTTSAPIKTYMHLTSCACPRTPYHHAAEHASKHACTTFCRVWNTVRQ